jgi:putative redox protein
MEYIAKAAQLTGMQFTVTTGSHSITTDYPLKPNDLGAGPRPLELLLCSLASCAGGSVVVLLRRAGHPATKVDVTARGQRRTEHPTLFTDIALEFVVHGAIDANIVGEVIEQSESTICPVWAMLKPGTRITSSFRVEP